MNVETMDLDQLARYLQRDAREVARLANRGHLPGRKVSGEWKFSRAEITHWVETQMHAYTEQELANLEGKPQAGETDVVVSDLLLEECVAVPLTARTKSSVLRELVAVAERSWHIYDPVAIHEALKQREELAATALESGVAIPHPRRPMPQALGESIVAYGRTTSGIPFGAPRGGLTDIFFLVCCRDDRTHLRVLARLSRLLLRPRLIDDLRAAQSPSETLKLLKSAEQDLVS